MVHAARARVSSTWRLCFLWFSGLLLLCGRVSAQNFSPPTTWTNTTTNANRGTVQKLASGAAGAILPMVNPSVGTINGFDGLLSASLVIVLSQQDYVSGTSTYKSTVETNIQVYGQTDPGYYFYSNPRLNSDVIYWGLAAFYAYRAYHDQFLLDLATSLWNATFPYFITADEATSFTQPERNVSIKPNCQIPSIAGGVFFIKDTLNDTSVNGETIGPFLALSAYLYEATKNQSYLAAAQLSASFMEFHMNNGSYILDTIDVVTCGVSNVIRTYNAAYFVEGLGVLANVTQNSTQTQVLENLIPNLVQFSGWNLLDGVVTENIDGLNTSSATLKGIYVRSLGELRSRYPGTPMASLLESYITVQYNAVLGSSAGNNYTTAWVGPAPTSLIPEGNVAALDVFNSIIPFLPPGNATTTSSAPGSTSTSPPPTAPASKTSHTGAIVGGVVGGIGGIAVLGALGFLLYRFFGGASRHSGDLIEKGNHEGETPPLGNMLIEPFVAQPEEPQPPPRTLNLAGGGAGLNSKARRINAPYGSDPSSSTNLMQASAPGSSAGGTSVAGGSAAGRPAGPPSAVGSDAVSSTGEAEVQPSAPNLLSRLDGLLRIAEQQGLFEQPPQYTPEGGAQ